MAEPIEMPFGVWTRVGQGTVIRWIWTLAPPGECDWTVHV